MKKAFIQKLSIAMASALVITAAAPATADAAAKMTMNRATKTLYLNEDNYTGTADTYDFSIKNKGKNYKTKYSFNWYADDESIVSVAKGGVVSALKVGKTTVKCDVIKKSTGKVYTTVEAVVTVKANAETVTINNGPVDDEMAVGTSYDFNRTMKSSTGGKATDKTEWIVSADEAGVETTDVASVAADGTVTALKPGTFYLSAKTYQSAATKDLGYTAESAAKKITVYASITEAKNTTTTKIALTFDADMSKSLTKDNVVVTNASGVKQYVKSVGFNADGTVATVELWSAMTDKVVYKVAVPEVKEVEFTASIGAPASIVVTAPTLVADNEATDLTYKLLDASGVEVNASTNGKVVFSTTASTDAWINGSKITIFQIGKVIPVKATYYTGTYDANGNEIKFESEVVSITCVDSVAPTVSAAATATVTSKSNGKDADWANASTTLPVNDTDKYLQIKYVKSDAKEYYTNNGDTDKWSFESTDTTKLIVNASTGKLLPLGEGQVVVIAKCGTFTTSFVVNITAKRVAASVTPDVTGVTLSNAAAVNDNKTVKLTVKDNYGADYTADTNLVKVEVIGNDDTKAKANGAVSYTATKDSVKFSAIGNGEPGTYTYKLTKCDKSVIISVVVVKPSDTVSYAKVKVDTTSFDTKVTSGSALGKINVSLTQIASNGVEVTPVTNSVVYTIKHSDGTEVTADYINQVSDGVVEVKPVIVTGGAYSKLKAGTYTVTAKVNGKDTITVGDADKTIIAGTFEIKDTQTTTAVNTKKLTLDVVKGSGNIKAQLANCFELADATNRTFAVTSIKTTVDNDDVTKEAGTYSVFVEKVTVTENVGGVSLNTEVTLNSTITVTVK